MAATILELDGEYNVKAKYYRGLSLIRSDVFKDPEDPDEEPQINYYLYNAHGDVTMIVDNQVDVLRSYEYDAFGNQRNLDEGDTNPFRYSGEYYDRETGTTYLRARYYAPKTGRFITEDSYTGDINDPLSLNLYTYCHNDSVNAWDPSGHKIKLEEDNRYNKEWLIDKLGKLTGYKLTYDKKSNFVHFKKKKNGKLISFYKKIKKKPLRYGLVDDVINNTKTVYLKVGQSSDKTSFCRVKPREIIEENQDYIDAYNNSCTKGVGTDQYVYIANTKVQYYLINEKTGDYTQQKTVPLFIQVGHELIHALYGMKGEEVSILNFNRPALIFNNKLLYTTTSVDIDERYFSYRQWTEKTEELLTIGCDADISKFNKRKYTENKLLIENGYARRVRHAD